MLENLTLSTFTKHLGQLFQVHLAAGERVPLVLLEATELGSATSAPGRSFSLLFRGPRHMLLPQRQYPFEHDQIGQFPLFIVPIKVDNDGYYYEVIFNRPAG